MVEHTLILGGARSGKSRRAQTLAEASEAQPVYIATAEAIDEEMAQRIAAHRKERGEIWTTAEAPLALDAAIRTHAAADRMCVVDCLTVWLSNLMHHEQDWIAAQGALCAALADAGGPVILVSNEVGLGIVPDTPLGRQFRDAQGHLNQRLAQACAHVEFVAAGLSIRLKGDDTAPSPAVEPS